MFNVLLGSVARANGNLLMGALAKKDVVSDGVMMSQFWLVILSAVGSNYIISHNLWF